MQYVFINNYDLQTQLRRNHMNDLIDGNELYIRKSERFALSKIRTNLSQRYEMDAHLVAPGKPWKVDQAYSEGDTVYFEYIEKQIKKGEHFIAINANTGKDPFANPNDWELDDIRNEEIVKYAVDITLHRLFDRFTAMAIPEDITTAYEEAIEWLTDVKLGNLHPALTLREKGSSSLKHGGKSPNTNWFI
jgi:hypothetical protein